jgi:hypothetical protein
MSVARSATIFLLKELSEVNIGEYVRVTGYVTGIEAGGAKACKIQHGNANLFVDLDLVQFDGIVVDSLVQFIGEICESEKRNRNLLNPESTEKFYLSAKIFRIVDGLDMRLFEESLVARRKFLSAD